MGEAPTRLPPRFDVRDLPALDDPYPVYAALRAAAPLCRGGPGQWVVTRYAEVAALLRDPRLGQFQFVGGHRQFSVGEGPASAFFGRVLVGLDPPAHSRLRRPLSRALSRPVVRDFAAHVGILVDELLAEAVSRGRFDAVADLAVPLPVRALADLLGMAAADRAEIQLRTARLSMVFAQSVPDSERAAADEAVVWLRDYVAVMLAQRRRRPGSDLLSALIAAPGVSQLSDEEIVDNAIFLLFAGLQTTTNLIATGCALLLRHPRELARLRGNPSLVPPAVEEFLRYDAPIHITGRIVREPVEVGGRVLRAGRVVHLLLGSANRDERVFTDPARLDVGRAPNPHLSFGGGAHYCLGARLARIEGMAVFDRLVRQFAALEAAGETRRRPGATFRTYASIPVAVPR